MKVWIRGLALGLTASQQRSMSLGRARASPQMVGPSTLSAITFTASKSPSDEIGNPASMISTPISARSCATSIFSAVFILAPGDCSPSRSVVSKIRMYLLSIGLSAIIFKLLL